MARKKRTWDQLQTQGIDDSTRTRNVYDDQQVARGHSKLRSKKPGYVIAGVVGVLVAIMAWVIISLVMFAGSWLGSAMGEGQPEYYKEVKTSSVTWCYQPVDAKGNAINSAPCYKDEAEAVDNPPQWYVDYQKTHEGDAAPALSDSFKSMNPWKLFFTLVSGLAVASLISTKFSRSVDAHNTLYTNEDVNEHYNDRHIAVPDEIIRQYEWFPDAGAHCSVEVSSLISHIMLSNKGLKKVDLTQRHTENVLDERGAVEIYKGSPITDDSGNYVSKSLPMIDEEFGEDLFTASGVPAGRDGKELRRRFDPDAVKYGVKPGAQATRKTKTYAEVINADWDLPVYEVQRPAGAYLVDTAPVNTMVLAITRAGKGQTYIEPMLDMWSREKNPNNMVINDPKGELLVKNIVSFTMRGFDVVQFNLINALTTDIYNPLALASQAAREGDAMKCSQYVGNIADVFFPLDGGEDPVWPQAANNAFKRAAYGLIDYYLEEEREQRNHARATNMDPKVLENRLDSMWGKVTLYNCYQLFVQMSSKKMKSPLTVLEQRKDSGVFGNPEGEDFNEEAYDSERAIAELREAVWDGEEERDMLTLYFNATNKLPKSSMREAVANADNSLRSMAGAEKMLASVYGIAITAMSFFTDARISGMTSGTPSQNVDLAGMSFPRRIGVRLNADFVRRDNLVGVQAVWDAFSDENFMSTLGDEFNHEDLMTRDGWARYYFRGIFPQMTAYLRLRLVNPKTNLLIKTFYFKFTKSFKTNLSGRTFIRNQITGEKVIKDGILVELVRKETRTADGVSQVRFETGNVTFPQEHLVDLDVEGLPVPNKEMQDTPAITQTMVRYSEMPKAVFLVTPPHMMKYAKLILILITQLVNLNFDQSYMTKENQKPLYKTRFMLDELGNLQSEGHGIADFATMLSIGLGQEQQFTIILQTLQQLRDVYGESVDKIVQGNAQPLDAKIATPEGWITMGEAAAGQQVLTPAGGISQISGVYPQGERPVYRVTRASGATTTACDEHLWEIWVEED